MHLTKTTASRGNTRNVGINYIKLQTMLSKEDSITR